MKESPYISESSPGRKAGFRLLIHTEARDDSGKSRTDGPANLARPELAEPRSRAWTSTRVDVFLGACGRMQGMLPQDHKNEAVRTASALFVRLDCANFTVVCSTTMAPFLTLTVLTVVGQVAGFALPRPQIGVPGAGAAVGTTAGAGGE